MKEGYIKFQCSWEESDCIQINEIKALNQWRQKLYHLHLIGTYDDGVGYGNVSLRSEGNQFYISGSKTGHIPELNQKHYSLVTGFDLNENWVSCKGPTTASSESMSHAVIYQSLPRIQAVFHIHHLGLWENLIDKLPTTDKSASYGTPEMGKSIKRLIDRKEVLNHGIFVMGGHREGLIAFGETLDEAGEAILKCLTLRINR